MEKFATALNVDKVKYFGDRFVTTQYEQLSQMEFKPSVATGIEAFSEMKGLDKARILGSYLLSLWLTYVGLFLFRQIDLEIDQFSLHSVSSTLFTSIRLRGMLDRFLQR
jgi:hypothetical protein